MKTYNLITISQSGINMTYNGHLKTDSSFNWKYAETTI